MKRDLRTIVFITLLAGLALPQLALAQYEIPASVVGGGGGTATGASYSLSGTVGQPAADIGLASGSYNHDGGFWPAAQALTGGAPSVPTATADSLALVALYNGTGGSNWNSTWDLGTPVYTWHGVTVAVDGRVTEIDLRENNLSGPIPAKIGDLTGLTFLNLNWNNLTGDIPAEIGSLVNLTQLRLRRNQLTGNIPSVIGSLTNLTDLFLDGNQLISPIPTQIGSLINLTKLDLSINQFTGDIPVQIGNLTSLSYLSLYNNQFTGPIPDAIQYLTGLTHLDFDENQLTGPIPAWIGSLTNLEVLGLGGSPFDGQIIPDEIGNLDSLKTLSVNSFQLPGTRPDWANLDSLTAFYLYGHLESDVIPAWVGTLTQLTRFGLWQHQLSGGIPAWVSNFTELTLLWIGGNQIAGAVPAAVANLTQLRYLYLHNNQLDQLPDLNPLKTSLLRLHVQRNHFTFEDIVPNVGVASEEFIYAPQNSVGLERDTLVAVGASLTLEVLVGGTGNQYQWLKDEVEIAGATNNTLNIAAVTAADAGSYVLRTTNTGASDLTLYSRPINVTVMVPPMAITRPPTNVTSAAAVIKGVVNPNGNSTTVSFEWGPSTAYGNTVAADPGTVDGTEYVVVSAPISGLSAGGTYHYRVVATNAGGTTEGDDQVFTTPADENTIVDNRVIPGSGTVKFWSTNIFMNFNFTNQTGEDVVRVSQVATSPTGTLPGDVGLVASRYWIIEHIVSSGRTFGVAITFVLWTDAISADDRTAPGNLRLLRRDTGSDGPWSEVVSGTSATDSSVTFASITGFSEFTIGSTSLAVDTEAPTIASVAIDTAAPVDVGAEVVVTASISDNRGVQDVFLHYGEGGAALNPVAMQAAAVGESYTHTYSIPGSDVTLRGLVFAIRAADEAGNADTSAIEFVSVKFAPGDLTTNITGSDFSGGFPKERWRLISVPAALQDASVGTIIGDVLGESTDETWRIFAYSGNESDPWREVANSNFNRGEAYWLNQWVESNVQFDAGAGTTDNLGGFDIIVKPGWNLIGTPYPFRSPIDLDPQTYYGPITFTGSDTALTGWTGTMNELAPWGGYAVYNRTSSNQTIILSAEPGGGLSKDLLAKETVEQPDGWLLQLQAEGKTYADVANAIGRLAGADEQLDYFDNPEPPYIDGFVSLAMERDDWGANLPRFTSDIRSFEENDGVWDLDLYVKGEKGPITLSQDLQGDLPQGNSIVLLDVMTREVHDLLADDGPLTFTRYREDFPYHLKVVAGSASYVEFTTKEILASLPSDFSLAQNYPNPFNPATHLRYSLFQPARVTLKIYNLLGQEVVTLVDGWQDLGHYEAIWEGRDRFGAQVASGVYFAAYMAEGRMFTRKMLLLK